MNMASNTFVQEAPSSNNSSRTPEKLTLATIYDDGKELIFNYLDWADLVNVADTSKQLYTAVCNVFNRKYKHARVDIGFPYMDRYSSSGTFFCPDILVTKRLMTMQLFRNFGHLITDLHLDYDLFFGFFKVENLQQYVAKYCSESLISLSMQMLCDDSIECFQSTFVNLKIFQIDRCAIYNFPLNKLFPNLEILRIGINQYSDRNLIKMHFPTLKHLSIMDRATPTKFEFRELEEFFKLNSQIESFEIYLREYHYNPPINIIRNLNEYFPNLRHLVLGVKNRHIDMNEYRMHSDQIESFSLITDSKNIPFSFATPFSFANLKRLELKGDEINFDHSPILKFIKENQQLTSIILLYNKISNINNLLELNIVKNIEEMIIRGIEYMPYNSIYRFLRRNHILRLFSIEGKSTAFTHFHNELITNCIDIKIRNRALEFLIEKTVNQSLVKYILRYNTWFDRLQNPSIFVELTTFENSHLIVENNKYYDPINEMNKRICKRISLKLEPYFLCIRGVIPCRILTRNRKHIKSKKNLEYLKRRFGFFNRGLLHV